MTDDINLDQERIRELISEKERVALEITDLREIKRDKEAAKITNPIEKAVGIRTAIITQGGIASLIINKVVATITIATLAAIPIASMVVGVGMFEMVRRSREGSFKKAKQEINHAENRQIELG